MESEFWGLVLVPNKKFSNESTEPVRLTMACFGEKVVKNSRSCVVLKTQEREFVICVLSESKNESQTLDVMLPSDGEYSFSVTGPNEVHLTGQILDAEEDSFIDNDDDDEDSLSALYRNGSGEYIDDDEDDEDDEDFEYNSDSDELEPANIEEIDDDDDDDDEEEEIVQAKAEKNKENAKKAHEKKSEGPETNGDKPLSKAQRRKLAKQAREETLQSAQGEKRKADEVEAVAPKANKKEKVEKKSAPAKEAKKEKAESKTAPAKEAKKENNDQPKITTLQGGLIVEDRVSGTGPAANKGSTVCVRYIGRLMNGKVFDSNQSGKPFSFKLGKGDVIKGWDLGIAGMKVGGQRKLTIPPALAYGARGAPPDIPKNAKLEFEVKLLEVKK